MEWNKKNTMDFIELYRKKSIIWDPQESDHYNKIKKQDAWVEIAEEIGKPVEECKKKMENLLASLRREKMKIKKSMGTGTGAKDVYKSNWFAFVSLQFILDKNKTKPSLNTMRLQQVDSQNENEPLVEAEPTASDPQDENEILAEAGPSAEADLITPQEEANNSNAKRISQKRKHRPLKAGKAKETASRDNERLDQAFEILQSTANQVKANQDECYYFGNCIASKLRVYDDSTKCAIQNAILNVFQQANEGRFNTNRYSQSQPTLHTRANTHFHAYDSQTPSPATPLPLPSPGDSIYSEDFNIQELL